jgi:hypothetical protein
MILSLVVQPSIDDTHWDAIVEQLHRATPLLSVQRKGLAFAGTDDMVRIHRLVANLSALASLAPTRTAAYLTALHGHPGRVDVHENDATVPVTVFHRVPELSIHPRCVDRLELFGLRTIGALRTLSERHLGAQFGQDGLAIARFLHAPSLPIPMYVPPPTVISTVRFEGAEREPGIIEAAVDTLVDDCVAELRGREAWRLELSVLDRADEPTARNGRILRQGAGTAALIRVHARALMRTLLHPTRRWWGVMLRLASIRRPLSEQTLLFTARPSASEIAAAMAPRYGSVLKTIEILDAWTVIPERFARIRPLR